MKNARSDKHRFEHDFPIRPLPSGFHPVEFETNKGAVLIVDSCGARRTALVRALDELNHPVLETASTSDALSAIAKSPIGVVLIDLFTPGTGAINFCRALEARFSSPILPVIVLSQQDDVESEVEAMEAGADGFLIAPIRPRLLRANVEARLRKTSHLQAPDQSESVLLSLGQSIEGRDPALGRHCERLALLATTMGIKMGLPAQDILSLHRGGYLHDIGKIGLPDRVLLKTGPLSPEEWETMKTHPERGEAICSGVRSLAPVLPIIRHHHEKWDGSGYPDGLRGDEIPLLARVLQMADIYDALTAERPYKRAFTSGEALATIRSEAARNWRDPKLVTVLEDSLPFYASHVSPDTTPGNLSALATSIGNYKKGPGRTPSRGGSLEPGIRLVSGL